MCDYLFADGQRCSLPDAGQGLCFWHDPDIDKQGQALAQPLSDLARQGKRLDGFRLSRADLRHLDLVRAGSKNGYSLRDADLYRADLRDAHLFKLDLRGSSLMKARLEGCNLHCADLRGANLLGIRWRGARVENVIWGERLQQEGEAVQAEPEEAQELYQQAEEIYRALRLLHEGRGMSHVCGHFVYRERVAQRYQLPPWSYRRLLSRLVDLWCGYGEYPLRIVAMSGGLILLCALIYWLGGIAGEERVIAFSATASLQHNLMELLRCLYFSVVTFTTLGYGDLSPLGFTRVIAAAEAFLGSFSIALFVVVFVRRMILSR